jgi:hypothetical protein
MAGGAAAPIVAGMGVQVLTAGARVNVDRVV